MNRAVGAQVARPLPLSQEQEIDEIAERLGAIFIEHLHIDVPTPDTDLLEAGLLDSFALVELLLRVEREFNVAVSLADLDIDHVRSLRSLSFFLCSMSSRASAAPGV
jgi:D-alanine--poly(phosphoribitol) ligase subunit 2